MQANVAQADIERLFAEAKKAFGRLDILVNNAGIYEFAPLEDVTEEHFHKQFDLNVLGLLLASQEALKHFGPAGGSIVNISSVVSTRRRQHRGVQRHQGRRRCRHPVAGQGAGPAQDSRERHQPRHGGDRGRACRRIDESDFRKQIEAQTPLGRIGQPQDIAPAVVFFASEDSAYITGETMLITGGLR